MKLVKHLLWRPFVRKTKDPLQVQQRLLQRILAENRRTRFGQEHNFNRITSYETYRDHVPVNGYEALRDYIENQESSGQPLLNFEKPLMFAQTSGTTGAPKNIPVLPSTVKQCRKNQHLFAYSIYRACPRAFSGKILAIGGPAVEGYTRNGTPFGSMSGLIYRSIPSLLRGRYVLPPYVSSIRDYDQRYFEIARRAVAEENITLLATANPSTLLRLEQVINEHAGSIIYQLLRRNSSRARTLERYLVQNSRPLFTSLWPNLQAVALWMGGNCGVLIPALRKKMPAGTRFIELGYLATEFRGTITIDATSNRQIPTLEENFFEFVAKESWEHGTLKFLQLTEIEQGRQYYVFVTNGNGLYRYHINDVIEVTGWFNGTPMIRFVQKGTGVTNLTGEKLCESQVVQTIAEFVEATGMAIRFFIMLGNPDKLEYVLYVEEHTLDADKLDRRLCALNTEYSAKRSSGRLNPPRVVRLAAGTGEAYKRHCLGCGLRESHFKMRYLQLRQECGFDFDKYVILSPRAAA